ncbi:helix-turn-helix transcriptional regulator [Lichenicoccus sp.]|uniref:helix-turn-helix transcriptional regulator n=1 Tax=Lichenicoccus sp. TaxID=2781899 RepID=UPI003D0B8DFE
MRHEDVWRALDTLAAEKGLSPSGLARAAGLDPTAFNRSKRATAHGRLRWPSTESLSRVLAATGASLETFTALVSGAPRALAGLRPSWRGLGHGPAARRLPQVAFSSLQAGEDPTESGEETAAPIVADPGSYAIRLDSPAFEPVLREGALLIASPEVPVRAGDRVILREANGAIRAGIVSLAPADTIALESFGVADPSALPRGAIGWMHRIGWASQ